MLKSLVENVLFALLKIGLCNHLCVVQGSAISGRGQSLVWPEGHEIETKLHSIRLLKINRMSGLRMTVNGLAVTLEGW